MFTGPFKFAPGMPGIPGLQLPAIEVGTHYVLVPREDMLLERFYSEVERVRAMLCGVQAATSIPTQTPGAGSDAPPGPQQPPSSCIPPPPLLAHQPEATSGLPVLKLEPGGHIRQ